MRARPRGISRAELEVLKALWELGPSTIRSLTERLYPGGGPAHYATVQKLLERLAAKRCVDRSAAERAHVFTAAVDRRTVIARRLRETAEELCDGSLAPLLTHLVDATELTEGELAALHELVDGLRAGPERADGPDE